MGAEKRDITLEKSEELIRYYFLIYVGERIACFYVKEGKLTKQERWGWGGNPW